MKPRIPSASRTCIFFMICAYQEEYRNVTKSMEGEGNETFKSKIRVSQEDVRKNAF
jgi:hypothetical protein